MASILGEASRWLEQRGIPMWHVDELNRDEIAVHVAEGLYFLAEHTGAVAGCLRFQRSDLLFWPDESQDDSAYLHRLAVRREFAGGTTSEALLSWAVEHSRSLGLRFVRLDCEASRPRLRDLYERFGFVQHSHRQVGPHFVARYQLDIALHA